MIESAIGLGLVINFIFSEFFGLAAGGMVVPGYVALYLHYPLDLVATLFVAFMAYLSIKFLSNFMFIYSKRLLMFSIIFGFLFGAFARHFLIAQFAAFNIEMQAIGMIIPGLITYWMHRQGIVETICMLVIASVSIRLILVLVFGGQIFI
jgi:poly-gamma-glutamate biosynthesis protein PgsC/CapC